MTCHLSTTTKALSLASSIQSYTYIPLHAARSMYPILKTSQFFHFISCLLYILLKYHQIAYFHTDHAVYHVCAFTQAYFLSFSLALFYLANSNYTFHIPSRNVRVVQLLHILTNTGYCLSTLVIL